MNEDLNFNENPFGTTFNKTLQWVTFLKKKLAIIISISCLGGVGGLFIVNWIPPEYKSRISFIVEEGKGSAPNLGGLASLAGQFGVEVPGGGSSGLLSGDNILLYFKSQSLAREVLLSPYDDSSKISFAEKYSEIYKFKQKWAKNKKIGKVTFLPENLYVKKSRLIDSLINVLAENIIKKQFVVSKTDKKAAFIEVSVNMKDETLSSLYCKKIVDIAIKRYLYVKTLRQKTTVDKLQKRADSLSFLLNSKTLASVNLQTATSTMDINPLYKSGTSFSFESTARDKTLLATIFATVTQNLELAKFTLSQETPVIQIIDDIQLPLKREEPSKLLFILAGLVISGFLTILFLIFRKIIYSK